MWQLAHLSSIQPLLHVSFLRSILTKNFQCLLQIHLLLLI